MTALKIAQGIAAAGFVLMILMMVTLIGLAFFINYDEDEDDDDVPVIVELWL